MEVEPIVNEEPVIEAPETTEEVTEVVEPEVEPGSKTDSVLLLKELKEERERRRVAEAALAEKNDAPEPSPEVFSEEGKVLQAEIKRLEGLVRKSESEKRLENLEAAHPALRDKADEFNDFRLNPENAGMTVEAAAKVFLAERNLLTKPAPSKGLEKETGGGRVPAKTGLTPEEIDEMRVNNYAEYVKRIKNGTLFKS